MRCDMVGKHDGWMLMPEDDAPALGCLGLETRGRHGAVAFVPVQEQMRANGDHLGYFKGKAGLG